MAEHRLSRLTGDDGPVCVVLRRRRAAGTATIILAAFEAPGLTFLGLRFWFLTNWLEPEPELVPARGNRRKTGSWSLGPLLPRVTGRS